MNYTELLRIIISYLNKSPNFVKKELYTLMSLKDAKVLDKLK